MWWLEKVVPASLVYYMSRSTSGGLVYIFGVIAIIRLFLPYLYRYIWRLVVIIVYIYAGI